MSILQALSDSPVGGKCIDVLMMCDHVMERLQRGAQSVREVVGELLGNMVPDSVRQSFEDAVVAAVYATSGMDGGIEKNGVQ